MFQIESGNIAESSAVCWKSVARWGRKQYGYLNSISRDLHLKQQDFHVFASNKASFIIYASSRWIDSLWGSRKYALDACLCCSKHKLAISSRILSQISGENRFFAFYRKHPSLLLPQLKYLSSKEAKTAAKPLTYNCCYTNYHIAWKFMTIVRHVSWPIGAVADCTF